MGFKFVEWNVDCWELAVCPIYIVAPNLPTPIKDKIQVLIDLRVLDKLPSMHSVNKFIHGPRSLN